MTAFQLLKSVLYEHRTKEQGTFFVKYNDDNFFMDILRVYFGDVYVDVSVFAKLDVYGHWFYSNGAPVVVKSETRCVPGGTIIPPDVTLTTSDGVHIYLYHID